MAMVFWLTFGGNWLFLTETVRKAALLGWRTQFSTLLLSWDINSVLHSLIIDGVIQRRRQRVKLSFPLCHAVFLPLSVGGQRYMARGRLCNGQAAAKNRPFRSEHCPHAHRLWLHGTRCHGKPYAALRAWPQKTILLTALYELFCQLPIYGFFTSVFFPKVMPPLLWLGLYFLGILIGILFALVSKQFMFRGEAVPFVMELPNYRMPGGKNVALPALG